MIQNAVLLTGLILVFLSGCSRLVVADKSDVPEVEKFQVVWSKNNDPAQDTGNLPIALNSPAIFEDLVFVGHNDGRMIAYNAENGVPVWSEKDNSTYHSGIIFFNEQIIYGTTQGRIQSRNYLTGELKWSVDVGASVETEGHVNNGKIFFQLRNHKIVALDASTGKILWGYTRSVPFLTTLQRASTPLVYDNKLFVGFADGHICALSFEDGSLLWDRSIASGTKFVDVDTSPVIWGDKLIVGSWAGNLAIVNKDNGDVINYLQYRVARKPFVHQDNLLIGTTSGELIKLDADLKVVIEKKVSKSAIGSMAIWKGNLTVGTIGGELIVLSSSDFTELGRKHLGHTFSAIFGELAVSENLLAVLSSRNRLYVFK